MDYYIYGAKNTTLMSLKFAKMGIKNFRFGESFDATINYFLKSDKEQACFLNEDCSFHKQYTEILSNFPLNKDVIFLNEEYIVGNYCAIIINRKVATNYKNGQRDFMKYKFNYFPLFSIKKSEQYDLSSYSCEEELKKLYNTYLKNYDLYYSTSRQIEYFRLEEFENNFFSSKKPFVILLQMNYQNELEIIQFIHKFLKKNDTYYHFRIIVLTTAMVSYYFPKTTIIMARKSLGVYIRYIHLQYTIDKEFVIVPVNLSITPDLSKINSLLDYYKKVADDNFYVFNSSEYLEKVNTVLFYDHDLNYIKSTSYYDDILSIYQSDDYIGKVVPKVTKSPSIQVKSIMDTLSFTLERKQIKRGYALASDSLLASKTILDHYKLLFTKITFGVFLKDFKSLEKDILKAVNIFKLDDDPDILNSLLYICISVDKYLDGNMLKTLYQKILEVKKISNRNKLVSMIKFLCLDVNATDIELILNHLKLLKEEEESEEYKAVTRMLKEIVTRKFVGEHPHLVLDLYNILYKDFTLIQNLKTTKDYVKMNEYHTQDLIYQLCTIVNQYQDNENTTLERRKNISQSLDILIENATETVPLNKIFLYDVGNFGLSYDGIPSKDIFIKKCKFFRKVCPELNFVAPLPDPPNKVKKIGFLSNFLTRMHSVYKDRHMVINHLSFKYDVYILTFDDLTEQVKYTFGRAKHEKLPGTLSEMRDKVLEKKFDVIVYPEIGMDARFYYLSLMKLAKVQINTWGHSDTSGVDTIDYFISSKYYEKENAQDHYSEKLITLSSLSTCYKNPLTFIDSKKFKSRHDFGYSNEVNIYLCPQSLFKLKPVFDDYILEILKKDKRGIVVLLDSFNHKSKIIKRLEEKNASLINRLLFVNGMPQADYLNLINICDVMLDTYPFGGCNSSFEAFCLGKPVVTQPSVLINGRFTYGFYRKMGIYDMIVSSKESYTNLAVKLGTNKKYNKKICNEIKEKSKFLFLEKESCLDWEEFIKKL